MVLACIVKRRECLGEEVYGVWSAGCQTKRHTKEALSEVVHKDCQVCKLNRAYAMDHSRWRKQI